MRNIGRLPDQGLAGRFADVLLAEGIRVDVVADDDDATSWLIWLHDDAFLGTARERLAEFREAPGAPRFADAIEAGRVRRKKEQQAESQLRGRVQHAQRSLYGADGRGWLTISLAALSGLVALISGLGDRLEPIQGLFLTLYPPSAGLPEVRGGQVWRLFTPCLVHFGMLHLLFNIANWWSWAQQVEVRKGLAFFGPLVASAALLTNLSEHLWGLFSAPHAAHLVGGMSGVLYAVFGYSWWKGRIDPQDDLGVPDQTAQWMFGWLVLCMTGLMGNVANAAHLSGLLWGITYAWLDVWWFHWRKRNP